MNLLGEACVTWYCSGVILTLAFAGRYTDFALTGGHLLLGEERL